MKPLILITNDDGIDSPGLRAAAETVCDLGNLIISAPYNQQTGMARAFPRTKDLGTINTKEINILNNTFTGYGVHGSPAYSVAHAVLEIADRKPDLCISGINYGENLGMTVTCSGTLGAAIEANSHGIPSIAVSVQADLDIQRSNEYNPVDWTVSKNILRKFAKYILEKGMPENVDLFNINVPNKVISNDCYRITEQSMQNYFEFIKPPKRNICKPYELKSELNVNMKILERDSDIYAIYVDRVASVTPISIKMSVPINHLKDYNLNNL